MGTDSVKRKRRAQHGSFRPSKYSQLLAPLLVFAAVLLIAVLRYVGKMPTSAHFGDLIAGAPGSQELWPPWYQCKAGFGNARAMEIFQLHKVTWEKHGQENPWYSMLTKDELKGEDLSDNLKSEFYKSGVGDIVKIYKKIAEKNGSKLGGSLALDFGCGLGRLAFALAPLFEHVACVDLSLPHLRIAEREAGVRGFANVQILQRELNLVNGDIQKGTFSFVGTLITLQHMVPTLQQRYIAQFCQLLQPGGFMIFQVLTYRSGYSFDCANDYKEMMRIGMRKVMEMHAIPQVLVADTLQREGCRMLEVIEKDESEWDTGMQMNLIYAKKL